MEAPEGEGEDDGKNTRKNHRQLKPVPQMGLGTGNALEEIHPFFKSIRKPYALRSYESRGMVQSAQLREWMSNPTKQRFFASRFSIPLLEDEVEDGSIAEPARPAKLRSVHSDDGDVLLKKNWTAKAIHAAISTGPRTYMERLGSRKAASVWVSQFRTDRVCDLALDGGPHGGMQGLAEMVLWRFSNSDHQIFNPELLRIVTHFCEGIRRGSDVSLLWPAVATDWTTPIHTSKTTKVEGARIVNAENLDEVRKRCGIALANDIDPVLLRRIVAYRASKGELAVDEHGHPTAELQFDDPAVIPRERQTCEPRLSDADPMACYAGANTTIVTGLCDVYLFQDVVHGVDRDGRAGSFKIDMVKIQAKFPALDPLLLVHQVATTDQRLNVELMSTLRHMFYVMNETFEGTIADAFESGSAPVCRVCCEAYLPMAVMRYAAIERLGNVHFGGFRADVRDKDEMAAWQHYSDGIYDTRKRHYSMIADEVALDLNNKRNAQRPLIDKYHLDLWDGQHYRKIPKALLDDACRLDVESLAVDDRAARERALSAALVDVLSDDEFYYVADGRPWARNTGVWMQVDTEAFRPFERKPSKEARSECGLIQPFNISPIVKLYLSNAVMPRDPLRILQQNEHMPDLAYLLTNRSRLPEPLVTFVDTMQRKWDFNDDKEVSDHQVRWEELAQLYGLKTHRVCRNLDMTRKESPLDEVADISHALIASSMKSALTAMCYGELVMWSKTARSLINLEANGRACGRDWVADNETFEAMFSKIMFSNDSDPCSGLLHDSVRSAMRFMHMDKLLDLKLSFQNRTIAAILQYNTAAHFGKQSKQYGSCIKIADMAHCVSVVTKTKFNDYELNIIDYKYPGAGADSLVNLVSEVQRAYPAFLCSDSDVQEFFRGQDAKDVIAQHISTMSMATYMGSGIQLLRGKEIDVASNHECEAGILAHLTEIGKMNQSSDGAKDQCTNIECFLNESGCGGGTRKQSWSTTRGLAGVRIEQTMGLPLGIFCSNRVQKHTPSSMFESGRLQVLASSTRDDDVGVFWAKRERAGPQHAVVESASANLFDDMMEMCRVSEGSDRPKMRMITDAVAASQRQCCLEEHLMRRGVPFLARTMTLNVRKPMYSFFTTFMSLGTVTRSITDGLRRHYLATDQQMSRTAEGPWESCLAYGMHVKLMTDQAVERAIRAKYTTSSGCVVVPMENVVPDIVQAMLMVPMCTVAILSSLFMWIFATVLDYSFFALSGHLLHLGGFESNCPLVVMALVMHDCTLTDVQERQYNELCKRILPLVASSPAQGTSKMRNVTVGHLSLPTLADFTTLLNFKSEDAHEKIKSIERKHSNSTVSVYVAPRLRVVQYQPPEWIQQRNMPTHNNKKPANDYATTTPTQIAATLYSAGQTLDAHKERIINGQNITGTEIPHMYWQAAHDGMRLPCNETKVNDQNNLKFEPVWETGHWYNETMANAGSCKKIVHSFLTMCGCKRTTTYEQFFTKLLGRYATTNLQAPVAVYNSRQWTTPILEDTDQAFRWAACTYQHASSPDTTAGVEVALCVNAVVLLVLQALCTQEWGRNRQRGVKVVSHLRVVPQAALELMTMLLHVHIDKAAVPANNGRLALLSASPFAHKPFRTAEIAYDPRLHIDSVMARDVTNVLSLRSRTATHFKLWRLFDDSHALYYQKVSHSACVQLMDRPALYFPFPPEAVQHMMAHFDIMQLALERFSTENGLSQRQHMRALPDAMSVYGRSVTADAVRHIPATLTHAVTQEDFELPCVTYKTAMIFVLKRADNGFYVCPVRHESSEHKSLTFAHTRDGLRHFVIPVTRVADAMCYGIKFTPTGACEMDLCAPRNDDERMQRLPFYLFPVVMWSQLVEFSLGLDMAQMTHSQVEIVPLAAHLADVLRTGSAWPRGDATVREHLQGCGVVVPDDVVIVVADSMALDVPEDKRLLYAHVFIKDAHGRITVFNGIGAAEGMLSRGEAYHDSRSAEHAGVAVRKPGTSDLFHLYQDSDGVHAFFCMSSLQLAELDNLRTELHSVRVRVRDPEAEMAQKRALVNREHELVRDIVKLEKLQTAPSKEYMQPGPPWRGVDVPRDSVDTCVGLVVPHEDGRWLVDGAYRVEYREDTNDTSTAPVLACNINFAQLAQCHVREGCELVLHVDAIIEDALGQVGLYLPRRNTDDEDKTLTMLCFYVLGAQPDAFESAHVRVLVLVASETDEVTSCLMYTSLQRVVLSVPLCHNTSIVRTRRAGEKLDVEYLVAGDRDGERDGEHDGSQDIGLCILSQT